MKKLLLISLLLACSSLFAIDVLKVEKQQVVEKDGKKITTVTTCGGFVKLDDTLFISCDPVEFRIAFDLELKKQKDMETKDKK